MGGFNSTTIWAPGVGYINANNPGYALPSPTVQSSIPQSTPQAGVSGMPQSPYLSGVTNTAPDPNNPGQTITSPTNPLQFATPEAAQAIASYLGGNVSQQQLTGPGNSWSTPQAQINVPGATNPLNAGLAAQNYGNYGADPTGYGSYKIAQDLGKIPNTETAAQFALSNPNFQMNPLLGNSGPGYNMVYNPTTGTYSNIPSGQTQAAPGQSGLTQAQAIAQMQQANGVTPSTPSYTPPGYVPPTTPPAPTSGAAPSGSGSGTPPGGGPPPATPSNPYSNYGRSPQGSSVLNTGGVSPYNPYTSAMSIPGEGTSGPNTSGGPNTNLINPPAPPGSSIPPNASNPFSGSPLGTGNPYNYLGEGYTDSNGNYVPPALAGGNPGLGNLPTSTYSSQDPFATGLDSQATNNRDITLSQGASIDQSLQNQINYQGGQANVAQNELNSAYTPIASGQGGYSQAQKDAILNQPYLNSLQITPGQEQSNYLTGGEQAGIMGNTQGVLDQLGSDEGAMDQNVNSNVASINSDLAAQTGNVNSALASTGGSLRGAVGQEASNINSYIDPTSLNASADYMQNENVSPQDVQNILDQAGNQVGNQELSDEGRLLQEANAAGNVSPLALSAARDRLRQQSAVGEAQVMTNAAVQGKNLQLSTTQARENTRLGAAQNYAGLGVQGAATEGAAAIGAEQYLGTQAQQAQQYLGTSALNNQQQLNQQQQQNLQYQTGENVSAGQTADQANSARAATIASNRQATNAYNQGQELQRGQYIYGQDSSANTNFANTQLGQEAEYRQYLQNQQAQANQNVSVGNQQRLGAYGTQTGGINQATSVGVANYGTKPGDPTTATNLINSNGIINSGKGNAEGGISQGPHDALVGEAGPELIVDLAPTRAATGDTASPSENPMYLKILAQMLGLGGGGGTTWGMDRPPSYASNYSQVNNYSGGSPSVSYPPGTGYPPGNYPQEPPVGGSTPTPLPVGISWDPQQPTTPVGTSSSTITYPDIPTQPSNPIWNTGDPPVEGPSGPGDNSGDYDFTEDMKGEVTAPYLSGKQPKSDYGVSRHAGGGIGEPSTAQHFYGSRSKLHKDLAGAPNVQLVTHPTVMKLGAKVPQAVLPLTPRKSNKVTPQMIPKLLRKYGNYGAGAPI